MAHEFSGSAVIDRPIDEVFAFLADGTNDTKIRWSERSKNMVTVPTGGYDLEKVSDTQTRVTIHNTLEGHGFGKVIAGFAVKAAIKDAPAFAQRIKSAVETS
jgi:carbon monoxide dehydrogenase subunit G